MKPLLILFALTIIFPGCTKKNNGAGGQPLVVDSVSPRYGNSGTFVTITGSGFSADTAQDAVSFGFINGKIALASATQLVVVVPPNPDSASLDSVIILVSINQQNPATCGFFHYNITPPQMVSTFAGSGSIGHANGTGAAASFYNPENGAFDRNGNLFVADYGNNEIREVSPQGVVSTYAGSTTSGWSDGSRTSALFHNPAGLAFDNHGNLYVSDQANNVIRKIDTTGTVSTIAGSGSASWNDGVGKAASFNNPIGIGYDSIGNCLYVADSRNNMVRQINLATNKVTTYAGSIDYGNQDGINGQPLTATFSSPRGITVESMIGGLYIYVADYSNNEIREIIDNGTATSVFTLSGSPNSQAGFINGTTTATYYNPNGCALGHSKVGLTEFFIADASNHAIRYAQQDPASAIAGDLDVATLAGNGTPGLLNGSYALSTFDYPDGVVYNPTDGNLYVIEFGNNDIRKVVLQ